MFFNKPKKLGQELADLALRLANSDEVDQFISRNAFTPEQSQRFRFGVVIVNIITTIWLINFLVQNRDRAKSIIDPLHRAYRDAIGAERIPIRIGSLIPYEEEQQLLRIEMMLYLGEVKNIENITSDMWTLTDMIYNSRQSQYTEDINKGMVDMRSNPGHLGPMFHVARRFAVHFTGKKTSSDDPSLVVELSMLFALYLTILMGTIKRGLGK